MADKVLTANRSDLGHSFLNAMWIAGFLATIQIVAVAMAVIKRSPTPDQPVVTTTPPLEVPNQVDLIPETTPEPPVATPEVTAPLEKIPSSQIRQQLALDLSEITDPVGIIKDSLIARLVDSGIEDRRRGNLKGSLDAFLDASDILPGHPRILSEIGGTYAQKGDLDLATKYWTQVKDMGPITAGPYFKIAEKVLRGDDASIPDIASGKYLKIGKVGVSKKPVSSDGEWVTLLIPIFGKDGETLSMRNMDIRVYFYDLINGTTPGQTTATITFDFPTSPDNWRGDRTEEIRFIYHQPEFTVEQKRRLGERVYFGYVIELYYQNQLQDSVVSSDELRSLRFPVSEPVEEPLPPQGPDTSLFPINR